MRTICALNLKKDYRKTKIGLTLVSILGLLAIAHTQPLRNEWIDFGKTYYRFEVTPAIPITGTPGNHMHGADYQLLYRIPFATLKARGLDTIPVQHFQLWRNGTEVPVYTEPASGTMTQNGFIEFWGRANDGQTDRDLYRFPINQTNDRWSMFSDTAYYYLTVNRGAANQRITAAPNLPQNSTLKADSFFMHTIRINPRASRNLGFCVNISNTEVRSSSWDAGEGWAEGRFGGTPFTVPLSRLFPFRNTNATISASFWSQAMSNTSKTIQLLLNDSLIGSKIYRRYTSDSSIYTGISLSRINSNDSTMFSIRVSDLSNSFRSVVSKIMFTYPRRFEFNKRTASFTFELPANNAGNLLKIINFDTSASQKILIDLSSRRRYAAVRQADTLWFALEPSAVRRSLVLTSLDTSSASILVRNVSQLTARRFTNYTATDLQGDYLIISNARLHQHAGNNPVEQYRQYRSSPEGGGYKARIYDIDSLIEQFGYNIRKHPIAIRNFIRMARTRFSVPPKAVLLMGRGATYNYSATDTNINNLNLVPTWGHPASDNLLAAADNESIFPALPTGRIAAITGEEVSDYLEKIIAFEALQRNDTSQKLWQKNVLHMIGGNDANIVNPIKGYMSKYEKIIRDTLVGADVSTFIRLNDPNTSANNKAIHQAVKNGQGLMVYFGHSSATSMDFNLNEPEQLEYTPGRFPVFMVNGCKSSEFFDLNPRRYRQAQLTLSEKFVLAKQKGAIAFISSTHYGILQYLDYFTELWYKNAGGNNYGKSLGEIHRISLKQLLDQRSYTDFSSRITTEQFHLHGDPVMTIHTQQKPDFSVSADIRPIMPEAPGTGTDSVSISFNVFNSGKAVSDTLPVIVSRIFPDGRERVIQKTALVNLANRVNFNIKTAVGGRPSAGLNQIKIQVDPSNQLDETLESNNDFIIPFTVSRSGMKPVFPSERSIVSGWPVGLTASPDDITADTAFYRFELDTTLQFNSPLRFSADTSGANGAISLTPRNTLIPGKVYYWRAARLNNSQPETWSTSSFTYLPGHQPGFNQGHYFQHLQSSFSRITLDSNSRKFRFKDKFNNLYITHGIYPFSATEDFHLSVTPNGVTNIYSACIGSSMILNVFDSLSFQAFTNPRQVNGTVGGCPPNLGGRSFNFEFSYAPASNRKRIMDFIDSIPAGQFVVARLVVDPPYDSIKVAFWKKDTALFGSGKSLYHTLLRQGFYELDSLNTTRTFSFVFRKNDSTRFKPTYLFSDGLYDLPVLSVDLPMTDTLGWVQSPWIGPAIRWDSLAIAGLPFAEPNGTESDTVYNYVLGKNINGRTDTLFSFRNKSTGIALTGSRSINSRQYPYIQLVQSTADSDNATPAQLDFWRVIYQPAPEGAIMPGDYLEFNGKTKGFEQPDTLSWNTDSLRIGFTFKNLGQTTYPDSLRIVLQLEDTAGNKRPLFSGKLKPVASGDTLRFYYQTKLDSLSGPWTLYAGINAAGEQPELTNINNFIYLPFVAKTVKIIPDYRRVFTGTGAWNDSARWTPVGVPQCHEHVIIRGNCSLTSANAVADSLTIEDTGRLELASPSSRLEVGCGLHGGNKLMRVKGALTFTDGNLIVNGGLLLSRGSQFRQYGGLLEIDPNNGDSATSLKLGSVSISDHQLLPASLSFGGLDTAAESFLAPYEHGVISLLGGTIQMTDPPLSDTAWSIYFGKAKLPQEAFGKNHLLVFGSEDQSRTDSSGINQFLIPLTNGSGPADTIWTGNISVKTGNRPGRKVMITAKSQGVLGIKGRLLLEENTIFMIKDGLEIIIGRQDQ